MRFTEYSRGGVVFERFGIEEPSGDFVRYVDGIEVERRAPNAQELLDHPPAPTSPSVDVVSLATELDAQRARLDAAEDALDHLIVSSLEGSL